jgi:hypothetical protein
MKAGAFTGPAGENKVEQMLASGSCVRAAPYIDDGPGRGNLAGEILATGR